MKHDEAMLNLLRKAITGHDFSSGRIERLAESACGFCETYAEVMNFDLAHQIEDMRWRSFDDEEPEQGQRIEGLQTDEKDVGVWHWSESSDLRGYYKAWRPFKGMGDD